MIPKANTIQVNLWNPGLEERGIILRITSGNSIRAVIPIVPSMPWITAEFVIVLPI